MLSTTAYLFGTVCITTFSQCIIRTEWQRLHRKEDMTSQTSLSVRLRRLQSTKGKVNYFYFCLAHFDSVNRHLISANIEIVFIWKQRRTRSVVYSNPVLAKADRSARFLGTLLRTREICEVLQLFGVWCRRGGK